MTGLVIFSVIALLLIGSAVALLVGEATRPRSYLSPDLDPALADDFAAGLRDVDILIAAEREQRQQEATRL